jgi:hypothetical protein
MRSFFYLSTLGILALLGCGAAASSQPATQVSSELQPLAPGPATSATPSAVAEPVAIPASSSPALLNAPCTFLGASCAAGLECKTAPYHERNAPGICAPKGSWVGAKEGSLCGTIAGKWCNPGLVCLTRAVDVDDASGLCSK